MKEKKEKRFILKGGESTAVFGPTTSIIVDKTTGVNYLWVTAGYAGGLTPLLDAHGNPVITPIYDIEKE